jgi:hypothetical protein
LTLLAFDEQPSGERRIFGSPAAAARRLRDALIFDRYAVRPAGDPYRVMPLNNNEMSA